MAAYVHWCAEAGRGELGHARVDGSGSCEMIGVTSHGARAARHFRRTAPSELRGGARWLRGGAVAIVKLVRCGVDVHIQGPGIDTMD